jgi:hypothetical protein
MFFGSTANGRFFFVANHPKAPRAGRVKADA